MRTTAVLFLLSCALTAPFTSAPAWAEDPACGPALSSTQFTTLLAQYAKAYTANDDYWVLSEQISDELFCIGKTPAYVSDLKIIEAHAVGPNPTAYLALSKALQNDWETHYLLKVMDGRLRRENLAAEGSNSLLVVTLTLGFFDIPSQISNYFGLFRQLIPVIIPSAATLTAKAINATGLLDNAYPPAPAHIMTELKLPQDESNYRSYDVARTLTGATLSVGSAVAATSLINSLAIGVTTIGSFTFNPLTIAASIGISIAGKYVGTRAVDEYEFVSLKNDLVRENESILGALANGDVKQVHTSGDDLYKSVVQLASSIDLNEINAWNNYQKGLAEVTANHHIPLIDESSAPHAREVYDGKMAKIQASRDPKSIAEVQLYTVLKLIEDSPNSVSSLPPVLNSAASSVMKDYGDYTKTRGENHYQDFIQSQMQSQRERLSEAYKSGNIPKDSQYLLLETISFLEIQNTSALNGAIKELEHLLQTGLILEMQ